MKTWLIVIVSGAVAALVLSNIGLIKNIFSAKNGISTMEENFTHKGSFYDFTVDDLEGNPVDLSVYKGKKVGYHQHCFEMRFYSTICRVAEIS